MVEKKKIRAVVGLTAELAVLLAGDQRQKVAAAAKLPVCRTEVTGQSAICGLDWGAMKPRIQFCRAAGDVKKRC
jgi:hypothetical protein